jgi:hypothetical protein
MKEAKETVYIFLINWWEADLIAVTQTAHFFKNLGFGRTLMEMIFEGFTDLIIRDLSECLSLLNTVS